MAPFDYLIGYCIFSDGVDRNGCVRFRWRVSKTGSQCLRSIFHYHRNLHRFFPMWDRHDDAGEKLFIVVTLVSWHLVEAFQLQFGKTVVAVWTRDKTYTDLINNWFETVQSMPDIGYMTVFSHWQSFAESELNVCMEGPFFTKRKSEKNGKNEQQWVAKHLESYLSLLVLVSKRHWFSYNDGSICLRSSLLYK